VENENGAGALPAAFEYFALPALASISPARGSLEGGTMATVRGSSFTPGTEVSIDGRPLVRASQFDSRIILGTIPSGRRSGPVEVKIRSAFGEARFPGAWSYDPAPPSLAAIEPPYGPRSGGTRFVLAASAFPSDLAGVEVTIGGAPATDLAPAGTTGIEGTSPPGAAEGPADVVLATPEGKAELAGGFRYHGDGLPSFLRGDANLDGELDLSDGIGLLGHLFLGEAPPPCRDAADGNDDGNLDISDPLAILGFLFTGGAAPPRPYPWSGADLTEDDLDCGS